MVEGGEKICLTFEVAECSITVRVLFASLTPRVCSFIANLLVNGVLVTWT